MGTYLAIGLVLAVAAVLGFKKLARRSLERGRTPAPLVEIHRSIQGEVSIHVFNEVWSKLGESFSIDPRLIRPEDKLKTLTGLDSWDLGHGEDALGQWLAKKTAVRPPLLETVLDLAKWVEASASQEAASRASS